MARPQFTAEELQAARARLTGLALQLYLEEGLEAVSFRRLAELAGISHTLPYRYFESKEALLVALRVECTQRFETFLRSREAANSGPLEHIREIGAAYVAFVQAHPSEYQMIFTPQQPAPDTCPVLLAARQRLFAHVVHTVEAAGLQGNALELAHLFWAAMHGLLSLHLAGQLVHGCTLQDLAHPLVESLLASHAPKAPKRKPAQESR